MLVSKEKRSKFPLEFNMVTIFQNGVRTQNFTISYRGCWPFHIFLFVKNDYNGIKTSDRKIKLNIIILLHNYT